MTVVHSLWVSKLRYGLQLCTRVQQTNEEKKSEPKKEEEECGEPEEEGDEKKKSESKKEEEEEEDDDDDEDVTFEEEVMEGRKYYVSDRINGNFFHCGFDDELGDYAGKYVDGVPVFA